MTIFITALISATTSIAVVVISQIISARGEISKAQRIERQEINSKFLNPLRLYLVENHLRLSELLHRIEQGKGRCADLLTIEEPTDLSAKDAAWYNGAGAYLTSSAYLTACLFACLMAIRDNAPYLRLGKAEDTHLITLLLKVGYTFRLNDGIYYVIQPSIGREMLTDDGGRVRSYKEFCGILCNPSSRVWLDRLVDYYLETGRGQKLDRVHRTITAIEELSVFLDSVVGGGDSLAARFKAGEFAWHNPTTTGPPAVSEH